MKAFIWLLFILNFTIFNSCSNEKRIKIDEIVVDAPFEMPTIHVPNFEDCPQFNIVDFGAKLGDKESNAFAIKKAIDKANASGCGTVVVPKGEWITKKIHLKSNVNLHIEKDAKLLFSEDPADYLPPVKTSWEGVECYNYSPLIYAYQCENVAITGQGTLEAKLDVWKIWYKRPPAHMESLKRLYFMAAENVPVEERQMIENDANLRPHFIQFNRSKNILIEGINIKNSPFWTLHPYLSESVTIRKVNVLALGHNNDGVDPEMSQNVLIEDCVFDQGDDAIAIKSGRNQDAWRLNTPSKNIVMRNCLMKNGHQLVAIGSELSGGVENVYVHDCEVEDKAKMFHLAYIKTNERRGGFVNNIYIQNINAGGLDKGVLGIETDVLYQWRHLVPTIEVKKTPIRNIHLENIRAKASDYISLIHGDANLPVEHVSLKNVTVDSVRTSNHFHQNVLNFNFN